MNPSQSAASSRPSSTPTPRKTLKWRILHLLVGLHVVHLLVDRMQHLVRHAKDVGVDLLLLQTLEPTPLPLPPLPIPILGLLSRRLPVTGARQRQVRRRIIFRRHAGRIA